MSKGPNDEVKSKLGYLNGETYNAPARGIVPGAGIPVGYWGKVNNRATTIKGTVFHKNESMLFPLSHQKIRLKNKDGKILKEVQSNGSGEFIIAAPIPNGEYHLELVHKKYTGALKLEVNKYEINNLKLHAIPARDR